MAEQKGLYNKYMVIKVVDGTVIEDCFILRPEKDPAAVKAMQAYAAATDNKALAGDIYKWVGKPLQKPLTLIPLDEFDICYIEFKDCRCCINPVQFASESHFNGMMTYHKPGWATHFNVDISGYGKYWRCWASRPTEEECAAAPWIQEGSERA